MQQIFNRLLIIHYFIMKTVQDILQIKILKKTQRLLRSRDYQTVLELIRHDNNNTGKILGPNF